MQTFTVWVEKVCEPLDLITSWPSFGSNNLNQTFPVVADETASSTVRRNFGPFLFTKHFQSSNILGMSGVNRSLCATAVSFGVRSGLWPGYSRRRFFPFGWSHAAVDLLLCFASFSSCITYPLLELQLVTDGLNFSCNNILINLGINFSIDDSNLSRPWGGQAAPNHYAPYAILHSWEEVLMLACVAFFFSPLCTLHCVFLPNN